MTYCLPPNIWNFVLGSAVTLKNVEFQAIAIITTGITVLKIEVNKKKKTTEGIQTLKEFEENHEL